MSSCLRHASHPFQFSTIEVIGSRNLSLTVVDAFLSLLKIVGVIAAISIYSLVVELKYQITYAIKKESVVGDHQQGLVSTTQETLQPLDHLQIQMVRGLIKYQQVGIGNQHIGECYTFLLSATQLPHRLLKVTDMELRQNLFGLEHFFWIAFVIETGIEYTLHRVKDR